MRIESWRRRLRTSRRSMFERRQSTSVFRFLSNRRATAGPVVFDGL